MRIAHLILTRHFAGSERHAIELANAQSTRHEVFLILRRSAASTRPDALAQRVAPTVNLVLIPDWLCTRHAARELQRLRPDVAHAHLSRACRALQRVPGLCLRVATLHIHYKRQQHARLDALVAIAPWQLPAIPQPLRTHTTHIDNWVLPQQAAPDARARLRQAYGIPEQAWVFGALGRVEPGKGTDVLVQAFQQADLADAWLVVVGRGPLLAHLRRHAGARVLLVGFSAEPLNWMSAFDVFVSCAHSEPFGLVYLEAMQAGLPVITTATQGARHLAPVMQPSLIPAGDCTGTARMLAQTLHKHPARRHYELAAYRIEDKLEQLDAFYARELNARAGD